MHMKKILSVAAVALLSTSGIAHADNIAWSGQTPGVSYSGGFGALGYAIATSLGAPGYEQDGLNAGNIETASPVVTNTWLIKGTVTKDCSYYGGSSTNHTLDFGTIGVNTQANTSVNNAFDMVSAATADIASTTAGCNFNNTVKIIKTNGVDGLKNGAAGGYDSDEFQANIPYEVTASFTGTTNQGAGAGGQPQTVKASTTEAGKTWTGGAWRSAMNLRIVAPTPSKALVAGQYTDTVTVELKAI